MKAREAVKSLLMKREKQKKELRESIRENVRKILLIKENKANYYGIQVLEDMLLPYVSDGGMIKKTYMSLKTSTEQRHAFKKSLLNAIQNILKINIGMDEVQKRATKIRHQQKNTGGSMGLSECLEIIKEFLIEEISLDFTPEESALALDPDNPEKKADAEVAPDEDEVDPFSPESTEDFDMMGDDEKTGVSAALRIASSLEKQIRDAIDNLHGIDEKLFSEYLLINLSLFLDKFEEDLTGIAEPEGLEDLDDIETGQEETEVT